MDGCNDFYQRKYYHCHSYLHFHRPGRHFVVRCFGFRVSMPSLHLCYNHTVKRNANFVTSQDKHSLSHESALSLVFRILASDNGSPQVATPRVRAVDP